MSRHGWWMIVGCVLPLLLIFAAPLLGLNGNWSLFLFIGLMFFCHFGMMGQHGSHGHKHSPEEDSDESTSR